MRRALRMASLFGPTLLAICTQFAFAHQTGAQPTENQKSEDAPWQHVLTGEDAKKVEKLEKQIEELRKTGKYREAQAPAREVLAIRARIQGKDHWQAADAGRLLQHLEQIAAMPESVQ